MTSSLPNKRTILNIPIAIRPVSSVYSQMIKTWFPSSSTKMRMVNSIFLKSTFSCSWILPNDRQISSSQLQPWSFDILWLVNSCITNDQTEFFKQFLWLKDFSHLEVSKFRISARLGFWPTLRISKLTSNLSFIPINKTLISLKICTNRRFILETKIGWIPSRIQILLRIKIAFLRPKNHHRLYDLPRTPIRILRFQMILRLAGMDLILLDFWFIFVQLQ